MPWRCPACETQIRPIEPEATPRPGVVYRCHVCRLELVVDDLTQKLMVPPLPEEPAPGAAHRPTRPKARGKRASASGLSHPEDAGRDRAS